MAKRVKNPCLHIPEELVAAEILVKLPVKSLLKFRSVCKSWYDLIRSPRFVDMHYKHPSKKSRSGYIITPNSNKSGSRNAVLKLYSRDDDGGFIPMAVPADFPVFNHRYLQISGHCNGIICIVGDATAFYLCNPATREFRHIPKSPLAFKHKYYLCARGFGFDPRTNEYKVVSIRYYKGSYKIEIYDLRSDRWRRVETVFPEVSNWCKVHI